MRNTLHIAVIVSGLAFGMAASAAESDARIETTSVPSILENLDDIDVALRSNDQRLAGLTDKDKADLAKEQAKVRKLLTGKGMLGDLTSRDRLTAFNSLEVIHGIVSGKKEDRVICRREHSTGSNRPQTNCMTAREREDARQASVMAMSVRGKMLRVDGM